jgi:hypothetical protein
VSAEFSEIALAGSSNSVLQRYQLQGDGNNSYSKEYSFSFCKEMKK